MNQDLKTESPQYIQYAYIWEFNDDEKIVAPTKKKENSNSNRQKHIPSHFLIGLNYTSQVTFQLIARLIRAIAINTQFFSLFLFLACLFTCTPVSRLLFPPSGKNDFGSLVFRPSSHSMRIEIAIRIDVRPRPWEQTRAPTDKVDEKTKTLDKHCVTRHLRRCSFPFILDSL